MLRRAFLSLSVVFAAAVDVVACGSSSTSATPAADDAGTAEASSVSEGGADSDSSTTSDGALEAASGGCGAGDLCFDVTSVNAGKAPIAGRLAVIWYQLDDDGPDPVIEIGYERAFAGTETRVSIPVAEIAPPSEPNLLCERACNDEATCPCLSEPKVGTGFVVVMVDENQNGKLDVGTNEATTEPIVAVAQMGVAYSDKAFKPAPPSFDRVFPDGIEAGVYGYSLVRPEGGIFDRFGATPAGTVFSLPVCDTDDRSACTPKFPNFT